MVMIPVSAFALGLAFLLPRQLQESDKVENVQLRKRDEPRTIDEEIALLEEEHDD
jgi:hypothetical protein